ncbi:MAG: hypothetical protein JNL32_03630 [Candidatus Kapabacteria bacterium]|nr:hypothetical protein [Candidatus Kapabacteria bacterium]
MVQRIAAYYCGINPGTNQFSIGIKFDLRVPRYSMLEVNSFEEFTAISTMLYTNRAVMDNQGNIMVEAAV